MCLESCDGRVAFAPHRAGDCAQPPLLLFNPNFPVLNITLLLLMIPLSYMLNYSFSDFQLFLSNTRGVSSNAFSIDGLDYHQLLRLTESQMILNLRQLHKFSGLAEGKCLKLVLSIISMLFLILAVIFYCNFEKNKALFFVRNF